ncbi:MFS transporter [Plantactinospora sp. KBS50]|uniref:MFS transporter n=1 Tax=Plantactinospora sp. KBS50 TaxID=2024580 RepID=UPI000BAB23AD|nr:MFS transporter [Plantactinospora sp. KBS50]ASW55024.1 MFS transporter [Plantactinospora sp. KBS50]
MGVNTGNTRSLWHNRDFLLFWLLQTLSVAGDSFSYVAIPLLVLHATGSVAQMGLLTGMAGAASVLTAVVAGVLVDRLDRRRLMIACDALRALAYVAVPLLWLTGPQVWLLYLVVPLGGALGMVFRVGYVTAVAELVDIDSITEANGRLSATYAVASVAGPMLAGIVCGLFGPAVAVGVDAATFALSAAGLGLVRLTGRRPAADAAGQPAARPAVWRDLLAGLLFLWRHPALRSLTVLLSLSLFLMLGLTDVFIYRLKHDLGQPDHIVGTVIAVAAVGTVVAALVAAPARRRFGFGVCWVAAQSLAGLAIALVGLAGQLAAAAALVAVYTFGIGVAGICSMSLRQQVTPEHLLGRVTSAFWTVHYALAPLGAAVLTSATARYGSASVLLVAGIGCLVVALGGLFTPLVRLSPAALRRPVTQGAG